MTAVYDEYGSVLYIKHETQDLVCPFTNETVAVDVGLLPLIKNLWAAGYRTVGCCQGDPDDQFFPEGETPWGYIYFHESVTTLGKAKQIVEDYGVENMQISFCRTDGQFVEAKRRGKDFYRWHIRFDPV